MDLVFQEIMEHVHSEYIYIYTVILSLINQRFIYAVILEFIKFFDLACAYNQQNLHDLAL